MNLCFDCEQAVEKALKALLVSIDVSFPRTHSISHLIELIEEHSITNSPASKYFFCSLCMKWHTDARKGHLQYRLHIQRDPNLQQSPPIQPPLAPSPTHSHHPANAILGSFDGAAHLWKSESEHLLSIPSPEAHRSFITEAKNLIALRKNNTIGYREKWLHSLLIKKHSEDLNSAVSQGLSYVAWLGKYNEQLKPRIAQLGWDVSIENLKLVVIAPDTAFENTSLDE